MNKYLSTEISSNRDKDFYFVKNMLINSRLQNIIEPKFYEMDGVMGLNFVIDGFVPASFYYDRKLPREEEVKKLFLSIVDCIEELTEYLLPINGLVLDTRYILHDKETEKYRFIYVPGEAKEISESIRSLFEELMTVYDSSGRDGSMFLYGFYSRLLECDFSVRVFADYMKKYSTKSTAISNSAAPMLISQEPEKMILYNSNDNSNASDKNTFKNNEKKSLKEYKSEIITTCILGIAIVLMLLIFGFKSIKIVALLVVIYIVYIMASMLAKKEADEIDKSMQTEIIKNAKQINVVNYSMITDTGNISDNKKQEDSTTWKLIPIDKQKHSTIIIDEDEIKLGRSKKYADRQIMAEGISRVHAILTREKGSGDIYLADNSSTNGTYINNVVLDKSGKKAKLKYGDIVSFAGEEFYFA